MKPWKTLPIPENMNMWMTLWMFCLSMLFIMSGLVIMFIGLGAVTSL